MSNQPIFPKRVHYPIPALREWSVCSKSPRLASCQQIWSGSLRTLYKLRGYLGQAVLIGMLLLWGNSAQAISLSGSDTARIIPQNDVRRFLGYGPTTGRYVDAQRQVDLSGEAVELTWWHRRGSWNFTQSWGLSYYQMDGSRSYGGETTTIDYSRLTINASLGYAFDFGIVDVHPQYMVGIGEGNFGFTNKGNGLDQEVDISNTILVRGPQLLFHFDLSKSYFIGLKFADYNNVGAVKFKDDEGQVEQNRVAMLIFGFRIQRSYSVYSKDRSHHAGIIDWFGY